MVWHCPFCDAEAIRAIPHDPQSTLIYCPKCEVHTSPRELMEIHAVINEEKRRREYNPSRR